MYCYLYTFKIHNLDCRTKHCILCIMTYELCLGISPTRRYIGNRSSHVNLLLVTIDSRIMGTNKSPTNVSQSSADSTVYILAY